MEKLRIITAAPTFKANEFYADITDPSKRPLWEIDEDFLNPYKELPIIQTWCEIGGRKAIPKQGLITFSAKQKQGKSLSTYALSLPLLSGKDFDTLHPLDTPNLIMVFDMEMSEQTLQKRYLSQLESIGSNSTRFQIVPLKSKNLKERIEKIEEKVSRYNPDIVIIDQAAKLMSNINDPSESSQVVDILDKLSINRSVWCVIHENKSDQDKNMRGHIGTELSFASVESYTVKREGAVFSVKYLYGRDSDSNEAEEVHFTYDDEKGIRDASAIVAERYETQGDVLKQLMVNIFSDHPTGLSSGDLLLCIMEKTNRSNTAADSMRADAVRRGFIKSSNDPANKSRKIYRLVEEVPTTLFEELNEETERQLKVNAIYEEVRKRSI